MAISVTLPKMGESVVEGTIIRWLKSEGDQVTEDEPLVEISTDKIDTELPAPASGILSKIVAAPDQTVEVGAEIAVIEEGGAGAGEAKAEPKAEAKEAADKAQPEPAAGEEPEAAPPAKQAQQPAASEKKQAPPAKEPPEEPAKESAKEPPLPVRAGQPSADSNGGDADGARGVVSSPLVRKLAREHNVELSEVRGTGIGGRVTKEDVLTASGETSAVAPVAARPPTPRAVAEARSQFVVPSDGSTDVKFSRMRRAIAEHMTRSLQSGAQLTTVIEVDMTRIAAARAGIKGAFAQQEGFNLTFMPFIAAATVQVLRQFPEFNAHILEDGQSARLWRTVNLGIAVGRDEGLIVPVVHDADGMNLVGLARAINDVGQRARAKGGLTPDDVTGGTFTLTNFGSFGGIIDTPIINQPQVAILGIGSIVKRPAVITVDGSDAVAVRHMMFLCLTYDHRWIDGHKAAQFNGRLKQILEEAEFTHELGLT